MRGSRGARPSCSGGQLLSLKTLGCSGGTDSWAIAQGSPSESGQGYMVCKPREGAEAAAGRPCRPRRSVSIWPSAEGPCRLLLPRGRLSPGAQGKPRAQRPSHPGGSHDQGFVPQIHGGPWGPPTKDPGGGTRPCQPATVPSCDRIAAALGPSIPRCWYTWLILFRGTFLFPT